MTERDYVEMRRAFVGRNPTEAHHVRGLLESVGIGSEIRGEALFGARGEIPITEAMPSVWVPETDLERARAVVADYHASGSVNEGDSVAWTCPGCGEDLEGQFTSCWNCGTERREVTDAT